MTSASCGDHVTHRSFSAPLIAFCALISGVVYGVTQCWKVSCALRSRSRCASLDLVAVLCLASAWALALTKQNCFATVLATESLSQVVPDIFCIVTPRCRDRVQCGNAECGVNQSINQSVFWNVDAECRKLTKQRNTSTKW